MVSQCFTHSFPLSVCSCFSLLCPVFSLPAYRYRVHVETRLPHGAKGPTYLRFQHPVLPGSSPGGWQKALPGALPPSSRLASLPRAGPLLGLAAHRAHKLISSQEVAAHQSRDDCWIVLDGTVYDVTPYMKDHPGGEAALLAATKVPYAQLSALFKSIHASDAYEITGHTDTYDGRTPASPVTCLTDFDLPFVFQAVSPSACWHRRS